ncbi:MAG TPA: hypothetical protein VGZ22_10455 [Isosphaeraceae bacterium]|nr:hypothetical protein [Isosphaeraceae bacterium]
MTFEECHVHLVAIRRRQGTRYPLVRIDCAGTTYRGRLARADSDPEHAQHGHSPYGVLVLEGVGLTRGPKTIVQIANIPKDGIRDIDEN